VSLSLVGKRVRDMIGAVKYTLEIRGNTVVGIDPPGKNGPLYERGYYKTEQARWRKVERFVPEKDINW
jgi:hypothetical protein